MRVERGDARRLATIEELEAGQCFEWANHTWLLTDEQKVVADEDLGREVPMALAVNVVWGNIEWISEDMEVKPLYAKVVVEW